MRRTQRFMAAAALIPLAMLGAALLGCSGGRPPAAIMPGYTEGTTGSAQVVGYLSRSDLEGGFWAVYDYPPAASSAHQPRILAVLLPGSVNEAGVVALNGRYVRASGRVSSGASIRMAGPEILVDAIDAATRPLP